jgi:hypothetical protein
MRALPLCVAAVLISSVPASAQEQSGAVQGVVRDTSGGPLIGATVEARSPAVVGVSRTLTDGQGTYRFPALPPATYTITASMKGFAPATSEAIIAIGQVLTINLTLGAEDYLIGNPGEGYSVIMEPLRAPNLVTPRPRRDYDALELHLRKRLSHNWAADATYTYSRLYGNYPGIASGEDYGDPGSVLRHR